MRKVFKVVALAALALTVLMSFNACAGGADDGKVLNRYVPSKIKPFDPAKMTDLYTTTVAGQMLEGLFQYKYLTDNYELEALVADGMPTVSADGLTYTFKIRKDAFFYDAAKKVFPEGKGRAITSKDFALSLKRLADPAVESGGWWLFSGFIAGLDDWGKAAAANGNKADYSANIEGVQTPDDSTLVIKLTKAYPQILYCFAMSFTYPIPEEMIKVYGDEWVNHVIGTGPYYLDETQSIPNNQYVLKKNPTWHGGKYPELKDIGPKAKALGLDKDAGKALPFVNTVNYYVIEAQPTLWLKFMNGEIDSVAPPKDNFKQAVQNNKLTPEMSEKGIRLDVNTSLDLTFDFFNMEDPLWGSANPNGKYMRQAVQMAIPVDKMIELFYNGRASAAQTVIPPGLGGFDPAYKNPYAVFNPTKSRELLVKAGYTIKEANGKTQAIGKDGKQLKFTYNSSGTEAINREWAEFYAKYLGDVGIAIDIVLQDWPAYLQKVDSHQAQFGGNGWGADYPDAQNFVMMLYGPNAAPGPNSSNYNNPEFNALYEKVAVMQPSPERDKIYTQLAQMAVEEAAMLVKTHRFSYNLINKWAKNIFFRDIGSGYAKYYDVDTKLKSEASKAVAK